MPYTNLVAQRQVIWDVDIMWPGPWESAFAGANPAAWTRVATLGGGTDQGIAAGVVTVIVGGGAITSALVDDALCAQRTVPAAGNPYIFWQSMGLWPFPRDTDFASNLVPTPTRYRYQWLQYWFQWTGAGVPTVNTGVACMNLTFAAGHASWFGGANAALFGIVGDGAGGWDWRVWDGVATTETLALGGALFPQNAWNLVEFRLTQSSAIAARDASLAVIVNGTTQVTRDWVNAPALPAAIGSAYWYPKVQLSDVGITWYDNLIRYRQGTFDALGTEIT